MTNSILKFLGRKWVVGVIGSHLIIWGLFLVAWFIISFIAWELLVPTWIITRCVEVFALALSAFVLILEDNLDEIIWDF